MNIEHNLEPFEDPLQNYDPATYADALEAAICEAPSSQIQHRPFIAIPPDTKVNDAVAKLAADHVACLLVVNEEKKLVGLFTHREVLNRVALDEGVGEKPVSEVMTKDPVVVHDDDPIAATLCVMAVHGYRHVPLVGANDEVFGVVSPQRVTKFLLDRFSTSKN